MIKTTKKTMCDFCGKEIKGNKVEDIMTIAKVAITLEMPIILEGHTYKHACKQCWKSFKKWKKRRAREWLEKTK